MNVPFWEDAYKGDISAFGDKPNAAIVEYLDLFDRAGGALDVGCGDGKNALYLAQMGFMDVCAFDISQSGIARLDKLAAARGLTVSSSVADICTYEFSREFALITSFGTLHFVSRKDWHAFIAKAKAATVPGGYNVMQIFTDTVQASPDIAPYAIGLAREGEIREIYADWEILAFKTYVFDDEHPGVPKHRHASNKITARRPR